MLTVDFDRLGVAAGDVVVDLGSGGGRHAFEARRRQAKVLALDLDAGDLADVKAVLDALDDDAPGPTDDPTGAPGPPGCAAGWVALGDALALPLADASVDRVIAAEVLEHVDDDRAALDELARVLRPGGTMAVTVPAWLPEWVCWSLSADYHAPAVERGHVRIYSKTELVNGVRRAGLEVTGTARTHALHSPYWWLRCAVGPHHDDHPAVRPYRRLLEWDITHRPRATRWAEQALNPVLGKSLVLYARRPATFASAPVDHGGTATTDAGSDGPGAADPSAAAMRRHDAVANRSGRRAA